MGFAEILMQIKGLFYGPLKEKDAIIRLLTVVSFV